MEVDASTNEDGEEPGVMKSEESLPENPVAETESGHTIVSAEPDPVLQDKMENLQLTDVTKDITESDTGAIKTEDKPNDNDNEVSRISEEAQHATKSMEVIEKAAEVEKKKPKQGSYTKVVCRNLPPTLRPEEFLDIVMDIDAEDFDYFHFTHANELYTPVITPSALLNFLQPEVATSFIQRFNGFIIVDEAGVEYRMEVDFAIHQAVPKPCPPDPLVGKIEETQFFKDFIALFNDSPDGVVGVRPQFRNAKTMTEHVLRELEEKEENKGKPQSTPLLDSLRQKLQAEQDKRARDRENQAKRRKERERQRAARREARREKQEQEKRERREKEKRDRERREKERRESKAKQGNGNEKTEKVQRSNEKDNQSEVKSESAVKKDLQTVKDYNKKAAADDKTSSQNPKNDAAQGPSSSSSRNQQRSKDYENKQGDRSYNEPPRRTRNERRNRNRYEKRLSEDKEKEKDRPPQKNKDPGEKESAPTQGSSKSEVPESTQKDDAPSKGGGGGGKPAPTPPETSGANTSSKEPAAEKPKTKVVKKVIKIVKVKSSDGVPTEGKVVEKKVVRKPEDAKKPNPEKSAETASSSQSHRKPEGSSSKDEATGAGSSSADRPRKGRPDMQIYRPGSWRQGSSGGSKPSNKNQTKDGGGGNKSQNDAPKTKDQPPPDSAKPKDPPDS